MARISVDHSQFEPAAQAVDKYINQMKNQMNKADGEVSTLSASWEGSDFAEFKNKWNGVIQKGSVYDGMKQALENYASFLRYAGKRYKEAQADAYNRAQSIPFSWY